MVSNLDIVVTFMVVKNGITLILTILRVLLLSQFVIKQNPFLFEPLGKILEGLISSVGNSASEVNSVKLLLTCAKLLNFLGQ